MSGTVEYVLSPGTQREVAYYRPQAKDAQGKVSSAGFIVGFEDVFYLMDEEQRKELIKMYDKLSVPSDFDFRLILQSKRHVTLKKVTKDLVYCKFSMP